MTISKTLLAGAALAAAAMTTASPAFAQARAVAVISTDGAVQGSTAWTNAQTAIRSTYAAQIQALETRQAALAAELKPMQDAYNNAAQQPNATRESVAPYAQPLAQKQQAAQAEMQQLQQPVALARAYVAEQISVHLDAAAKAAMAAAGVDLALRPEGVLVVGQGSNANLTDEVVAELNKRVQNVSVTPPAGWQPGQLQQAAQPQQ
ncbi:OmpH family outer membrane protein [Pacificimonas sp. WHA3]|uniref:OmpH family outer membrane protein n=1 Tax=Pacificimonas pallii TaxID=2827236 RepID=A0ABS6SDZ9_9SPHN|nr:OmpH family outer membrane protein [Pacificimonas pallii]MBV7256581.1 OmpH family outer membrane protein [Pacificimonas pallii]